MNPADPKPAASTADLLLTLIEEIRGLRDDMRKRGGLPDVKIGKAKMRDWQGPSYEGRAASECPADFLLEYAGFLEWKAGKDREKGEDGYATKGERDALMARRWAAVNRGVIAAPERKGFASTSSTGSEEPSAGGAPKTGTWGQGAPWKKPGAVQ